jgi:transposase
MLAAVERVPLASFKVNPQAGGRPRYHPRLMLALLVYSYANGIFSSRRIERATHRDVGVCFVAANTHPDHDTIAVFGRSNKAAAAARQSLPTMRHRPRGRATSPTPTAR